MSAAGPEVARAAFPALGGSAVVLAGVPEAIGRACAAVRREVREIDRACSRFRADSELSRVNAAAGDRVQVGALFGAALDVALRAAELTGGEVDPTCGAALPAWGYDRDFGQLRAGGVTVTVAGPVAAPGWRAVEWDRERRVVRIPAGSRLDFGATAKALAADRAARSASAAAGCGVLVSLSGDVSVCGRPPEGGWQVRVTDDHRSGVRAPGQSVALTGGGLATSSTSVRRWWAGGAELHHLVEARTGRCAVSCWRTVSVAAASCVDANIASTAGLLRGEGAAGWLAVLRLPARLVRHDGSVVAVGGWPGESVGGRGR